MQKVVVVGLGYVGFPLLCAITRSRLYNSWGYDINGSKIATIQKGVCPVDDEQTEKDMQLVSLQVTNKVDKIKDSNIYILCVPTPVDENNYPILDPIKDAIATIGDFLTSGNIIIVESTINPGVCDEVVLPILEKASGLIGGVDFHLAHCPERINPGDPKRNVYNIPRNIGAVSSRGCKKVADFYKSFLEAEIYEMETIKEVEATKIVENTFRDINIAYVNELAKSFDKLGINVVNVIQGASNKPFAFMAHYPGCGVGGHCIAVDPYYLIEKAKTVGFDHKFLMVAREVNNSMPMYTVEKLIKSLNILGKSIKGTSIALLGLSYKKNVGDMRESPSLQIKKILESDYSGTLIIYDPYFPEKNTFPTLEETLQKAEAIILATDHSEFLKQDYIQYTNITVIIDGRNCLPKHLYFDSKILYEGIGR